jgi:hypothetical protein
METTSFLNVDVAWREYRSKETLVFSFGMTRLIAVEDFNIRIRYSSFKSYIVEIFL